MKTAGIVGGLGPETTAEFYLEVNFGCQEKSGIRPPILIWNVPIPLDVEADLIRESKGEERYLPFLIDAAKRLESGGADFLAVPCNSVHIFIEQVRSVVKIPVLSITEEASRFLEEKGIQEVGLLATDTLLRNKIYEKQLLEKGIQQVIPDGLQQARIGKMIHRLVSSRHDNRDREELMKIVESFSEKGVKYVLLACTDLQLL
ncbi:MAG: amino acid racemase, partial [Patescibacteria group bacterium]